MVAGGLGAGAASAEGVPFEVPQPSVPIAGGGRAPVRRIYYALQQAYIGNDEERAAGLADARKLVSAYAAPVGSTSAADLAEALAMLEAGNCYQALKLCREVIRMVDGVALGARPTAVAAE